MDSRDDKSNHSLVGALVQLDIGGQSRGVINELPNEMLRAILSRVPLLRVIRFRLVDKKWKAVIENICRDKKSLMIKGHWEGYLSTLSNIFNGHLELNHNFVVIRLKSYKYNGANRFCPILARLFPQIERFFTNVDLSHSSKFISMLQQWSSTLTTLSIYYRIDDSLCEQINKSLNLKQLNLGLFDGKIATKLAPTLNRLEHFSEWGNGSITKIVPFFESRLTSFGLTQQSVTIGEITSWRNVNAQFVSNLERLSLAPNDSQVLTFICNNFSSLQMLSIVSIKTFEFSTDMMEHLARLTHLTELRLDLLSIHLASIDLFILGPLLNIRSFSLVNFAFLIFREDPRPPNYGIEHFCRILSTIFPNLNKLTIKSNSYPELENVLESLVNLFLNLRSHDFSLDDPLDR